MKEVTTIGLDIAKHVFQAHGIGASGEVIFRRKLRRNDVVAFFEELPGCLIGIEACATAHFWARQLISLGHECIVGIFDDALPVIVLAAK